MHREGGAHRANTSRANPGGVIGEAPDDRGGSAEEESFQLAKRPDQSLGFAKETRSWLVDSFVAAKPLLARLDH